MTRRAFMYGTIILFAANLFNRILAFVYQYFIMNEIGSESYGIYQMVFPAYMMAVVFTTAGIPLAVSKLVSEQMAVGNRAGASKTFRTALGILVLSGGAVASTLYFIVPRFAENLFPDARVYPVFMICIPAVFIVAVSSVFRGYFQGVQDMRPPALAQVCEQLIRVITGASLALKLLPYGVEYGAMGLALGMVAGEIVGLATIIWQYIRHHRKLLPKNINNSPGVIDITRQLFGIGAPITAGRLLASGASTADSLLIPLRLQAAGFSLREAASLYGQFAGGALTLLTFPTVFTLSLATALVPALSESMAQNRQISIQHRISEAIRITIFIGTPFIIFLFFYGRRLSEIFKSSGSGAALTVLALGGIFYYLQSTTAGILQGLGHPQLPVLNSIIGSILKLTALYYLTASPAFGLVGTAWSYNLAFVVTTILNLRAIALKAGLSINLWCIFVQPLTAGVAAALGVCLLKIYFAITNLYLELGLGFIITATIYIITLLLNKGIVREDLKRIPFLGKLVPF